MVKRLTIPRVFAPPGRTLIVTRHCHHSHHCYYCHTLRSQYKLKNSLSLHNLENYLTLPRWVLVSSTFAIRLFWIVLIPCWNQMAFYQSMNVEWSMGKYGSSNHIQTFAFSWLWIQPMAKYLGQ